MLPTTLPGGAVLGVSTPPTLVELGPAVMTGADPATSSVKVPSNCAWPSSSRADLASMLPVCRSNTQLPPFAALPVTSVELATSAPVSRASASVASAPSSPSPKLQP